MADIQNFKDGNVKQRETESEVLWLIPEESREK